MNEPNAQTLLIGLSREFCLFRIMSTTLPEFSTKNVGALVGAEPSVQDKLVASSVQVEVGAKLPSLLVIAIPETELIQSKYSVTLV